MSEFSSNLPRTFESFCDEEDQSEHDVPPNECPKKNFPETDTSPARTLMFFKDYERLSKESEEEQLTWVRNNVTVMMD